MFIRREWRLGCRCPECGTPLPPLVTVQEQVYPEAAQGMTAPTVLSPTLLGMSGEHQRCVRCRLMFEAEELDLFLEQVQA